MAAHANRNRGVLNKITAFFGWFGMEKKSKIRLKYRLQRRIFRSQNNTPNKLVRLVLISAVCIADKESNDSTSGKNIT